MHRLQRSIAALLALATCLPACAPTRDLATDVEAKVTFEPAPCVGEVQCTVALVGLDAQPLRATTVQLEGNMNHAGMVPTFATLQERAPGEYAGPLRFTMGGDWFVVVSGSLEDGRAFETTVAVPGVPAQPGDTCACCAAERAAN
ncbi:MAG: FixH family protein [Planctomycetota bacterium]